MSMIAAPKPFSALSSAGRITGRAACRSAQKSPMRVGAGRVAVRPVASKKNDEVIGGRQRGIMVSYGARGCSGDLLNGDGDCIGRFVLCRFRWRCLSPCPSLNPTCVHA